MHQSECLPLRREPADADTDKHVSPHEGLPFEAQRRGVSWVLRHAAILAVLVLTAVHVAGVACLADAERRLIRVAETAAAEAVLPKASLASVQHQVIRLLAREGANGAASVVGVYRQGKSVQRMSETRLSDGESPWRPGDLVRVTLTAPAKSALPHIFSRLAPWLASEEIIASAEVAIR